MKAYLFGLACLILWGIATPAQEAQHQKPKEHHATSHKNHHSDNKTSISEPGALKNIILHKATRQKNKPNQISQINDEPAPRTAVTAQATGRAILVQNANNGVGHVVQGSTIGKAPVIVINSDASGNKAGSLDPFAQDCLDAHNNYRAKHGVPPLMWSRDLAEGAQTWADQLASTDSLQHDQVAIQNRKMGENLAYFQPAVPKCEGAMVDNCVNCREMVQRWYDEVKNYDFDKGGPKTKNGPYKHFSQLIWANTAEMGVGTAVSKRYGFITVARYRPSGNEGGFAEFTRNVPPEGGPLPTMSTMPSLLGDNTKPSREDTSVVSNAPAQFSTAASVIPTKNTKQDTSQAEKPLATIPAKNTASVDTVAPQKDGAKLDNQSTPNQPLPINKDAHVLTNTTTQAEKPSATIPAKNTASLTTATPQKDGAKLENQSTPDLPLPINKDAHVLTNTMTQAEKPSATIPTKNTASLTTATPQNDGAKLENQSTSDQPLPINQGAHAKGGFVHALTANDGTKAQVYLSKNGAHAGIVFRNKISRVPPEEESNGVKRTIYVL